MGIAAARDSGRSCPYCRFPIKEGVEVQRCPSCDALHHLECWDE
ncbi:MAG: RING finger protein, partial [Solirubrobacteraceae bacterium]